MNEWEKLKYDLESKLIETFKIISLMVDSETSGFNDMSKDDMNYLENHLGAILELKRRIAL